MKQVPVSYWAAVALLAVAYVLLNAKTILPALLVMGVSTVALGLYLGDEGRQPVQLAGRKVHPFLPYWLVPPVLLVLVGGLGTGLSFVVAGLLLAGLCYGGALYFTKSGPALKYSARFANRSELEEMKLATINRGGAVEPLRAGVVVGEDGAGLYGLAPGLKDQKEMGHVLVVGPTRRGKGLNLTTNLVLWPGSAVVTDIKQECLASGYRATLGRVVVLDPTGRGHQYDPVRDLGGDQQALFTAAALLLKIEEDGDSVFAERAASAVVAAFRSAQLADVPSVPHLAELVQGGLMDFVSALAPIEDRFLQARLIQFLGRQPKQMTREDYSGRFLESAWSTMTARLAPLFTDEVLAMFNGHDFSAAELMTSERPLTVYLSFPERSMEANRAAFDLIMYGITRALMIAGDSGAPRRQETLILADEAKRAKIPDLPGVLATLAGRGTTVVTYIQDMEQLTEAYGLPGAASILSNSQTQVWYTPADLKTAEYLSKRLGRYSYMQKGTQGGTSVSYGQQSEENVLAGIFGSHTTSNSTSFTETDRELKTPDEILKSPLEEVICFVSTYAPAKIDRANWLKHDQIIERVKKEGVVRSKLTYTPKVMNPKKSYNMPINRESNNSGMPDDVN